MIWKALKNYLLKLLEFLILVSMIFEIFQMRIGQIRVGDGSDFSNRHFRLQLIVNVKLSKCVLTCRISDGILSQSIRSVVAAPFTYWAVKLKAIKREFSLWSLGFSISSRYHLLSMGISRLLSVRMWKC